MSRRRKSGFDELLTLPWQGQLLLAGFAALIALISPFFAPRNAVLVPLMQLVQRLAWYAALGLLVLAGISYAVSRLKRRHYEPALHEQLGEAQEQRSTTPHRNADPTLDAAWKTGFALPVATKHDSPRPDKWSVELLRELEWKRFELVCAAFYEQRGFRVETIRCGADGGIDAKLFFKELRDPVAIIQCKAWNSKPVGVKPVRELLGVMAHNKVAKGIFHATGDYTREAGEFARANKISLISGADFVNAIDEQPELMKKVLLEKAVHGDYTTPTCPSCAIKMLKRASERGEFWGCSNYPRCRQTFQIRSAESSA